MNRSLTLKGGLALSAVVLVVACGGSDTVTPTDTTSTASTGTTTSTTTGATTGTTTGTTTGASTSGASTTGTTTPATSFPAITKTFGAAINPAQWVDYVGQTVPAYASNLDSGGVTSNARTTLGRVLFYDRKLSVDDTLSCSSCHQQSLAFSDPAIASVGVAGGLTERHSMRLVNARFGAERKFFWDERAASLEAQTTQPIRSHEELGFSGVNGRPGFDALLAKLAAVDYLQELFTLAYGDASVTEARLQDALGQFVRSIQSFDSRYDAGRAQVGNDAANFPNFTAQENLGKTLFLTPPVFDGAGARTSGGLGCQGCHRAPLFDIDPNTRNNGIVGRLPSSTGNGLDLTNTRAPSLRDLAGPNGEPNSPMMHTGVITSLQAAIGHYGAINIAQGNTNLDPRLTPGGVGQRLQLTATEVQAVIAFLKTLTGQAIYTDARWSNPFLVR